MRPNSSNVVEFISSWIALGCNGIDVFVPGLARVLNPNVWVSLTRTRPSHLVTVDRGTLQLLAEEKVVP